MKMYHASLDISLNDIKNLANDRLVKDVIKGKAVIVLNSFGRIIIKLFYPNGRLRESQHKYNQMFRYSFVSRSAPYQDQIYQMLAKLFQNY